MEIVDTKCEFFQCMNTAEMEVSQGLTTLFCNLHGNADLSKIEPLKITGQHSVDIIKNLNRVKTKLKITQKHVVRVSELLISKINTYTFAKLQEILNCERKINKIIESVLARGIIFQKVLESIKSSSNDLNDDMYNTDNILGVLSELYTQTPFKSKVLPSGSINQSSNSAFDHSQLLDSRLLSRFTPIHLKLELLSYTSTLSRQLPIPATPASEFNSQPHYLLRSPTRLHINPELKMLLTAHVDNTLRIWKYSNLLTPYKEFPLLPSTSPEASRKILDISLHNDYKALITTESSFHLLDLQKLVLLNTFIHANGPLQLLSYLSEEKLAVGSFKGLLHVFNVQSFMFEDRCIIVHNPHGLGPFNALECSEPFIVAGGKDGCLKVWNYKEDLLICKTAHAGEITAMAISKDGEFVMTAGEDKFLMLWKKGVNQFSVVWAKKNKFLIADLMFSIDASLILVGGAGNGFYSKTGKLELKKIEGGMMQMVGKYFEDIGRFARYLLS